MAKVLKVSGLLAAVAGVTACVALFSGFLPKEEAELMIGFLAMPFSILGLPPLLYGVAFFKIAPSIGKFALMLGVCMCFAVNVFAMSFLALTLRETLRGKFAFN